MIKRNLLIAAGALVSLASAAQAQTVPACAPAAEYTRLSGPLKRVAERIANREPVTIVAIGSSSTAGVGASSIDHNYPTQLEKRLNARFPSVVFHVINRGMSGAVDREMLARFEEDVQAAQPDLVLWQVGTNALLNSDGITKEGDVMRDGLRRLRAIGADVVLIDPQYAPKVLRGTGSSTIIAMIAQTARETNANLFRRYELMRRWREIEQLAFDKFISPDELHMNDWSYACVARAIGTAIGDAAIRPAPTAQGAPQPPSVPQTSSAR